VRKNYNFSKSENNPYAKKAEKQLEHMVHALRRSATKLGGPTPSEIEKLVIEVRKTRKRRIKPLA
jgi:hypothetical protein